MAEPNNTSSEEEREEDGIIKDTVEGVATGIVKGAAEVTDNIDTVTGGFLDKAEDFLIRYVDPGTLAIGEDNDIVYIRDSAEFKALMKEGQDQGLTGSELEQFIRTNTSTTNLTDGLQTGVGKITSTLSQFAFGWVGANRALKFVTPTTKAGKATKIMGEGALAETIAFDEDEERLSNLIQDYPSLENPITAFLAADPEDTFAEAKLKQALEGAAIEGTVLTVIKGLKALRANRRGFADAETLAREAAEEAVQINNGVVDGIEEFLQSNDTIRRAYEEAERLGIGEAKQPVKKAGRDKAVTEMTDDAVADLQQKGGAKTLTNDELIAQAKKDLARDLAPYTDNITMGIQNWVTRFGGDVVQARNTLVKATQLVEIADNEFGKVAAKFKKGEATQQELSDAFKSVLTVTNLARGGFSESGRMLEFSKVVDGWNLNALNVAMDTGTVFADNLAGRKRYYALLTKYADNIAKAGNKSIDIVNELFINSILSGFKTHLVNIGSNTFTMALRPLERLGGAALRLDGKEAMNALRMYQGLSLYSWQSLKGSLKALREGKTQLDIDFSTLEDGLQDGAIPGILGKALRLPTRLLAAEDELFKGMNFRAFVFSEAMADGKSLGLRGKELTAYVDNQVNNAVTSQLDASILGKEATDPLAQRGIQYGREATFTQKIENPSKSTVPFANVPQQLGYAVQKAVSDYPILRQINPFIRTPLNLLSFTAQRSPLAPVLSQRWRDDFAAGGQRASEAVIRWTAGSGLALYFYNLANSGVLTGTGSGLTVDQKKNMQDMYGYSDNAIYDDGEYYNVARLSPASDLMTIMASISELERYGAKKEAGELAMAVGLVLSDFARDKSFLQGMNQFVNAVEGISEDGIGAQTESFLGNRAAALVPYSGFIKQFNNDPNLRVIRDIAEGYKKNIPGLSQELDPQRNILGEVKTPPEFWGSDFASPIGITTLKDDPLAIAFKAAADNGTPYDIPMPPKSRNGIDLTDRKFSVGLDGSPLNKDRPQQTAYDRMLELSGIMDSRGRIPPKGRTLREELTALVQDPRFKSDATFDVFVGDKLYKGSKVDLLKKTINHYRDLAFKTLVGRNPYERGSTSGQFSEPDAKGNAILLNVRGAKNPLFALAYWTDWKLKSDASKSLKGQDYISDNVRELNNNLNAIFQ